MDLVNIATFVLMATLLVISPGPNGALIVKTVPTSGSKAGFANILGFIAAFYVHGTLSVFGISVLLLQSAEIFFVFKILGAAYLCWLGIKSILSAWRVAPNAASLPSDPRENRKSMRVAFLEGFITNALNPKVSMFYLAAFPQFLPFSDSAPLAYILVSAHAAVNLVWFSAMVILLTQLKGLSVSTGFSRWLKSVTGVFFLGFGAKLAFLNS
ncbi:LysE family translocator [Microbulbifer harenosus]|uniref:LysE family translocator n=2 Tax=Microbulbifer harenosus TaxID=2576840 RepID=A0ABY2ULG5_9GAMM|nr:LysE family translocator [Microbulbifer harenosus]